MRESATFSGAGVSALCALLVACANDAGSPGGGGTGGLASGGTTGVGGAPLGVGGITQGDGGDPTGDGAAPTGGSIGSGGRMDGGASGAAAATGGAAAAGGGAGGTGAGGAADGGVTGSGGSAAILPTPDCDAPIDLGVHLVGRHDGCDATGVRMSWSGTGFVARFAGTGLTFTQSGGSLQYSVFVDGAPQANLETQSGEGTYTVVSGLGSGEHVVEVYRRGEASFGTSTLHAVEVVGGGLLPSNAPQRRIEIFGDSITCGYGNEGDTPSCPFSADTENHTLAYGALLAQQLGAEVSTVAWSGKGVVVNYGGDMSTTLPEMLDRADPNSDSSIWDFSLVSEPQAVVINLGTNDYSTDNDPTEEEVVSVYGEMLDAIRARYPQTYVVCTLGPLLSGSDLDRAWANIQAAVSERRGSGDARIEAFSLEASNPNPGCDYHPNLLTHQWMAQQLAPVLKQALGW